MEVLSAQPEVTEVTEVKECKLPDPFFTIIMYKLFNTTIAMVGFTVI